MMRYFFDTVDQGVARRDSIGVDCETELYARKLARRALAEMFAEAKTDGSETLVIRVRDAEGGVFEGRLSYTEQ